MNILYHIIRIILPVVTILTLIRNEKIYQAHKHTHPTKQNKIYHLTITSPNNIHHIPDNIIPYIKVHIILKNYEITNSTHRNDLAPNPK